MLPSTQALPQDINSIFSQHITSVLANIGTKQALDMTPEELQVLSLFINFKSLNPQINAAASITTQSLNNIGQASNKVINQDSKSEENIQMVGELLRNVSGPEDLVAKQLAVLGEVTENATQDIEDVSQLYQSGATPEAISSASTSAFVNQIGYLSVILNLLACYKNRLNEFGTNLKTNNLIIFFIMSALHSVASFILFCLFKIFTFLLNTKVGKLFLVYQFIVLYRANNSVAVFIANALLKLLKIVDANTGFSEYATSCIETAKQILIDNLPELLKNSSIAALLTTAISSALSSPTVLTQFIGSLAPQVSSQIISSALPAITNGLAETLANATPQIAAQIAQGIAPTLTLAITEGTAGLATNIAAELTPVLIQGVTTGMAGVITTAMPPLIENAIVESGKLLIQAQAASTLTNSMTTSFTNLALTVGAQAVGSYFGVPIPVQGLLTNGGGSNKKNKSKKYKKRRTPSKAYKNK
jgi:hypothetical protein